jgi:hypothetical protein
MNAPEIKEGARNKRKCMRSLIKKWENEGLLYNFSLYDNHLIIVKIVIILHNYYDKFPGLRHGYIYTHILFTTALDLNTVAFQIIKKRRTFTVGRPPYAKSGYLTGNFRKLWPRRASSSLSNYPSGSVTSDMYNSALLSEMLT